MTKITLQESEKLNNKKYYLQLFEDSSTLNKSNDTYLDIENLNDKQLENIINSNEFNKSILDEIDLPDILNMIKWGFYQIRVA